MLELRMGWESSSVESRGDSSSIDPSLMVPCMHNECISLSNSSPDHAWDCCCSVFSCTDLMVPAGNATSGHGRRCSLPRRQRGRADRLMASTIALIDSLICFQLRQAANEADREQPSGPLHPAAVPIDLVHA